MEELKDIILIAGDVHPGTGVIETGSRKYELIIVDFTKKDGTKRLLEIQEAVASGTFDNWLELVFLPRYRGRQNTGSS